jgi:hypothetical protein
MALVVLAAVGGAVAGAHPSGLAVSDVVLGAVFAGLVTAASAYAPPSAWLIEAGTAAVLARTAPLTAVAVVPLGMSVVSVAVDRRSRLVGAIVGALSIQVLLRLPPFGFRGFTALATAAAVLPAFVAAYRHAGPRVRRGIHRSVLAVAGGSVVFIGLFAIAAVGSSGDLDSASAQASAGLAALRNGDQEEAIRLLEEATRDFERAHHAVTRPWALPAQASRSSVIRPGPRARPPPSAPTLRRAPWPPRRPRTTGTSG